MIIPVRLQSRDAAAGLRSIEESGQAADAASGRFRKAYESLTAASQEYLRLRRALRDVPAQEAGLTVGPATGDALLGAREKALLEGWPGSGEGPRTIEARLGDPAARPAVGSDQVFLRPTDFGEPTSPQGANRAQLLTDAGSRDRQGDALGTPAVGLIEQIDGRPLSTAGSWDRSSRGGRASEESARPATPSPLIRRGPTGSDLGASLEGGEAFAEILGRPGPASGVDIVGQGPNEAGRGGWMGRGASVDYQAWSTGELDGGRDAATAGQPDRPLARVGAEGGWGDGGPTLPDRAEARHDGMILSQHFALRDKTWKNPISSPIASASNDPATDGHSTRPDRGSYSTPSRNWGPEAGFGASATSVIERLLREQNDLIRQDLQRDAGRPIAAPPPMRGGGIRM